MTKSRAQEGEFPAGFMGTSNQYGATPYFDTLPMVNFLVHVHNMCTLARVEFRSAVNVWEVWKVAYSYMIQVL